MDKKTIVLNYEQTQIVESENEKYKRIKFHSVITEENEEIYLVSEDRKDLILDVKRHSHMRLAEDRFAIFNMMKYRRCAASIFIYILK